MKVIENFKLTDVPVWKIIFISTSVPAYSMERICVAGEYPNYGDYTLISGNHCSCFGFDETRWDAITYTRDELLKVVSGWEKSPYRTENDIADMIIRYLNQP